jgi:hypothetical protein
MGGRPGGPRSPFPGTAGIFTAVLGVGVALILVTPASAVTAHQAAAHRQTTCTNDSGEYSWVTVGGVNYYLGTPNTLVSGSAAIRAGRPVR